MEGAGKPPRKTTPTILAHTGRPPSRSPSPFPDDEEWLVAPRGEGAYGLRLARAVPLPAEGAPNKQSLFGLEGTGAGPRLKAERLIEHELPPAEKIPADALAAAFRCGFVTNIAVSDALDRAPGGQASACLCCYRVHGARRARALSRQLQLIQRYYVEEAYARSGAMYRNLRALISDVPREVQQQIKAYVDALETTPPAVREANRWPGLCFAAPDCGQARVLWVYSTARGRRFLRKLGKRCRAPKTEAAEAEKGEAPMSVQISVAVADPSVVPKFWYKMYVARLGETGGSEAFWALVEAIAAQVGDKKQEAKSSGVDFCKKPADRGPGPREWKPASGPGVSAKK